MMKNIDTIKEELAQAWLERMGLDELQSYYLEKTEEFLDQESDEDVLGYAEDCGIDIDSINE
jgi:hypothetical protein